MNKQVVVSTVSAEEMFRKTSTNKLIAENHIKELTTILPQEWVLLEYRGTEIFEKIEGARLVLEHFRNNPKIVCVVLKDKDVGPPMFDKVFKTYQAAVDYILTKDGYYGTKQGSTNSAGVNIYGEAYCISGFNGYNIVFTRLEE